MKAARLIDEMVADGNRDPHPPEPGAGGPRWPGWVVEARQELGGPTRANASLMVHGLSIEQHGADAALEHALEQMRAMLREARQGLGT